MKPGDVVRFTVPGGWSGKATVERFSGVSRCHKEDGRIVPRNMWLVRVIASTAPWGRNTEIHIAEEWCEERQLGLFGGDL